MKYYKIGRDEQLCDIVIDDPSNQVSREHAIIRRDRKGRYFITDFSANGTFVNGNQIHHGEEYPLDWGDSVSFANVILLDWSMLPRRKSKSILLIICSFAAVILISVLTYYSLFRHNGDGNLEHPPIIEQSDSLNTNTHSDTVRVRKEPKDTTIYFEKKEKKTNNKIVKEKSKPALQNERDTTKTEKANNIPINPII